MLVNLLKKMSYVHVMVLIVADNANRYFFSLETGYSTCDIINRHAPLFEILAALYFL